MIVTESQINEIIKETLRSISLNEERNVIHDIEYDGCCADIDSDEWESRMDGKRPFPYKKLVKMIKAKYPDIYEQLALQFPNPWEEDTYETPEYYVLTHSAIEFFFRKI